MHKNGSQNFNRDNWSVTCGYLRGLLFLFVGVFADVSLHQWASRKPMKSSFQSNPRPTVLGSEPPGSRILHMTMFYHVRGEGVIIFLSENFLCQTRDSNPGHLDRYPCVFDHCATEITIQKSAPNPKLGTGIISIILWTFAEKFILPKSGLSSLN